MRIITSTIFFMLVSFALPAQKSKTVQHLDLSGSIGSGQGTSAFSYQYNWQLGKKGRFEIGTGARFTSYFGNNQYYITAPAKLTSGKRGPQVLFVENINSNLDSVLFQKAQVNALNIMVNLGYHITPKIYAGFNIDAIGFSFGKNQQARYFNGNSSAAVTAKPAGFNLLLISDNDKGSLNSELYVRYHFNKSWAVKAGYQFLFTEYKTSTKIQTFPEANDRFRNKTSAFGLGLIYQLKNKK